MDKFTVWLKAKIALLIIADVWGSFILREWPLMVYARYYDLRNNLPSKGGWLYSILIGQDHHGNTHIGGHFRTTFSSEIGNQAKTSKTAKAVAAFVDKGFELAAKEYNHCENAIEAEDQHQFQTKKALIGYGLSTLGRLSVAAATIAIWEFLV